ncbi:4-hydroxyphenylpyruvate dioxygenase, partial [Quercus suber]
GVHAIAIEVEDAESALHISISHGAKLMSPPIDLGNKDGSSTILTKATSFIKSSNSDDSLLFLPNFESVDEVSSYPLLDFGIQRLDHIVSSVPKIAPVVSYPKNFTRFHEFVEFTAEDVRTCESRLNFVVLVNNEEIVLLPLTKPVFRTKRKSQIYRGVGLVYHLALESEDIHI